MYTKQFDATYQLQLTCFYIGNWKKFTIYVSAHSITQEIFVSKAFSILLLFHYYFFFQAEDGIRDSVASRGLGDVYKRQQKSKIGEMVT